jgi:hypothetical protein
MLPWAMASASQESTVQASRHRLEVEPDPIPHPVARNTQESQGTRIQTKKSTGQSNTIRRRDEEQEEEKKQ